MNLKKNKITFKLSEIKEIQTLFDIIINHFKSKDINWKKEFLKQYFQISKKSLIDSIFSLGSMFDNNYLDDNFNIVLDYFNYERMKYFKYNTND